MANSSLPYPNVPSFSSRPLITFSPSLGLGTSIRKFSCPEPPQIQEVTGGNGRFGSNETWRADVTFLSAQQLIWKGSMVEQ